MACPRYFCRRCLSSQGLPQRKHWLAKHAAHCAFSARGLVVSVSSGYRLIAPHRWTHFRESGIDRISRLIKFSSYLIINAIFKGRQTHEALKDVEPFQERRLAQNRRTPFHRLPACSLQWVFEPDNENSTSPCPKYGISHNVEAILRVRPN